MVKSEREKYESHSKLLYRSSSPVPEDVEKLSSGSIGPMFHGCLFYFMDKAEIEGGVE